MKRMLILLLAAVLLFSSCAAANTPYNAPVRFYYPNSHTADDVYDDYFAEGVITFEIREAADRRENWDYLLAVYLKGPLDSKLASPFPDGCQILSIHKDDRLLSVQTNSLLADQSEIHLTVACACLAKTCMELTDTDTVLIECRSPEGKVLFSRTFTAENLLLRDDYTPTTQAINSVNEE